MPSSLGRSHITFSKQIPLRSLHLDCCFVIISCFAVALSAHETLHEFPRSHEQAQLDEVSMASSVAGIARKTSLGISVTAEDIEQ